MRRDSCAVLVGFLSGIIIGLFQIELARRTRAVAGQTSSGFNLVDLITYITPPVVINHLV